MLIDWSDWTDRIERNEQMSCEMCLRSDVAVDWYIIDDNAEVELCARCAKAIRDQEHVKVEVVR
jgi:ribosome-binding protein aMBF1 (putative translation factor)